MTTSSADYRSSYASRLTYEWPPGVWLDRDEVRNGKRKRISASVPGRDLRWAIRHAQDEMNDIVEEMDGLRLAWLAHKRVQSEALQGRPEVNVMNNTDLFLRWESEDRMMRFERNALQTKMQRMNSTLDLLKDCHNDSNTIRLATIGMLDQYHGPNLCAPGLRCQLCDYWRQYELAPPP